MAEVVFSMRSSKHDPRQIIPGPGAAGPLSPPDPTQPMNTPGIPTACARRAPSRLMLALAILAAAPAIAAAAGLNGIWRMDVPKPSGVTLHTYIVLRQSGDTVSGSVSPNGSGEIQILDARRDGDQVAFRIDWGWDFRVRPEGPNLRVAISYGGGARDEEVAVPVSADEMRQQARAGGMRTLREDGLRKAREKATTVEEVLAETVADAN